MRKSFTLIELIFVIVIIGIISALLILNMPRLKSHTKVISTISTTYNGALQAYEAAQVLSDIEGNDDFKLKDLVEIKGSCWKYNKSYKDGLYGCYNNEGTKAYSYVVLEKTKRVVTYRINCNNFDDSNEQEFCQKYVQSGKFNTYSEEHLNY